jgi:O-antigen/teichoic acid export membrane protein
LRKIFGFTFWNYIANIINMLPALVLPLLITQYMTPSDTAYYYVSMMIASLLFVIPIAISSSLFAEGSFQTSRMGKITAKASKLTTILLVPAIIVFMLISRSLLSLFGKEYADAGTQLLYILSLSAIPQAVKGIYLSVLNVQQKMFDLILVNAIISVGTIGFSILMVKGGLLGIGFAWLIGQCLIFPAMGFIWFLRRSRL